MKCLTLVLGPDRWTHGALAVKDLDGLKGVEHLTLIVAGQSNDMYVSNNAKAYFLPIVFS